MSTNNEGGIIAVSASADPNAKDRTVQPVDFRIKMIKIGLEAEMMGMRLTAKAPKCFTIIAKEYGIKVKRGSGYAGKRAAYEAFCALMGFAPKPPKPAAVLAVLAPVAT